MFTDLINTLFNGCTTDIERIFVMMLFIFILELVASLIEAFAGGARR